MEAACGYRLIVTSNEAAAPPSMSPLARSSIAGFGVGATVGILGGLVGLGGAEFRLPLLVTLFGFAALAAVIVNKAMSLVVVVAAIPARLAAVPLTEVADEWGAAVNLLAGSLLGAWLGARWATRMASATLYRVLAALLVFIAAVFAAERLGTIPTADLAQSVQVVAGIVAGFGIGVVAALLGVAGGELLIPTFVLLYAVDTKTRRIAIPPRVIADHVGGVLQVLPGSGVRSAGRKSTVRGRKGRWLGDRCDCRGDSARGRTGGRAGAAARSATPLLGGQGVASRLTGRELGARKRPMPHSARKTWSGATLTATGHTSTVGNGSVRPVMRLDRPELST